MIDSFGLRLTNWYGPDPTGLVSRLFGSTSEGTIEVLTPVSPETNEASGCFRCTTTVCGSGASMLATEAKYDAEVALEAGSMIFS